MKEKIANSISKLLEKAALDLAEQPGCRFLWGETELPDEIREEASKKRNNAKEEK